ncbi:MAG TPA: ribosome maturation factor RimM [Desulfobacteraceae bacterium]|nr:ribosome maturation factor RimM [Desulfobacteraceae bacterium]
MSQVSLENLLIIGKVLSPHGLEGMLRILSYAHSEASFMEAGTVYIKLTSGKLNEYVPISIKPHKNAFLMALEGINSREDAEELKSAEILIEKRNSGDNTDVFFWHEILGLKGFLDTGEYIGTVSNIISSGSNDIYVLHCGEREILIPATHEVVKEIDLENGKIIISPIEGLLDLNEV